MKASIPREAEDISHEPVLVFDLVPNLTVPMAVNHKFGAARINHLSQVLAVLFGLGNEVQAAVRRFKGVERDSNSCRSVVADKDISFATLDAAVHICLGDEFSREPIKTGSIVVPLFIKAVSLIVRSRPTESKERHSIPGPSVTAISVIDVVPNLIPASLIRPVVIKQILAVVVVPVDEVEVATNLSKFLLRSVDEPVGPVVFPISEVTGLEDAIDLLAFQVFENNSGEPLVVAVGVPECDESHQMLT